MPSENSPRRDVAITDDLSFLLARANAISMVTANAALAKLGLKARSYAVLAIAAGEDRPSQREIAEFLRLDPSQVVALVDLLQAKGLVVREPDPSDRRANVVVATDAGRKRFAEAQRAAREAERVTHSELDDDERDQLTRLLHRVAFPG